jgi:hypothetical protein
MIGPERFVEVTFLYSGVRKCSYELRFVRKFVTHKSQFDKHLCSVDGVALLFTCAGFHDYRMHIWLPDHFTRQLGQRGRNKHER